MADREEILLKLARDQDAMICRLRNRLLHLSNDWDERENEREFDVELDQLDKRLLEVSRG